MLMVSLIWGGSWAVGRLLALSLPPATGAWMRYVACMVAFYIWFAYKSSRGDNVRWLPSRDSWWRVSIIALFAVRVPAPLHVWHEIHSCWGCLLDHNDEPDLHSTACGAIPCQKITGRMVYGLVISFVGVVIVTGWSPNTDLPLNERLKGDLMIMLAALCWATATNLTRIMLETEGEKGATSTEIVVWYSLVGTILLTPWWLLDVYGSGLQAPNLEDMLAIFYLSILSTVLAYIWFVVGLRRSVLPPPHPMFSLCRPLACSVAGCSWMSA